MFSVLFVEDDADFCEEISEYLERYKISTTFTTDIISITRKLKEINPDLLILDQFIVGQDTLVAIPDIRKEYSGGIVVFTGNLNAVDRIVALECGADDFISKQCDPREFLARLRSVLRRVKAPALKSDQNATEAPSQRWVLDRVRGIVQAPNGEIVRMTSTEFAFLLYAETRAGSLMTRDQISQAIFRRVNSPTDRSVDNIRGRGYVFIGLNKVDGTNDADAHTDMDQDTEITSSRTP